MSGWAAVLAGLSVLLVLPGRASAQPLQASPELRSRRWQANWIVAPGTDPFGFGVYHFRKAIDLPEQPRRFVVHVTADNATSLYV
jgi:hypothetical protein